MRYVSRKPGERLMSEYTYTVILEREDDGGYHAFCPVLRGCHSQGDTVEEAIENIREAVQLYIESLKAHSEEIPAEDVIIKPIHFAAVIPTFKLCGRRDACTTILATCLDRFALLFDHSL